MAGIARTTYKRLHATLLSCAPVGSDAELRAVFVAQPLSAWRDAIPEADRRDRRVEKLVDFLASRQNAQGENALVLFLQLVQARVDPRDRCHQELSLLIEALTAELPTAPNLPRLLADEPAPYPGLAAFTAAQSPFFFGREEETEALWRRLQVAPFMAVVGPSGSGKSSLVRAGLISRAARQGWPCGILAPSAQPLTDLAARLADLAGAVPVPDQVEQLADRFLQREDGASTLVATWPDAESGPATALLVVDQFEQLFSPAVAVRQRDQFVANLVTLARVSGHRLRVVITVRLDYLEQCARLPALRALLERHQLLLGPLAADALRAAIVQPAAARGAEFEKGLVQAILRDAGDRPGVLPLVQVALAQLWQGRVGPWLTHERYEAIGGVGGAIDWMAEDVYATLSPAAQALTRRLFGRLVQLDEEASRRYTARPVTWAELRPSGASVEAVQHLIGQLSGPALRLVTADAAGVSLTHESLIPAWRRLREWIQADRERLITHQRLARAARLWRDKEHQASYLYRGEQLAEALALVPAADWNDLEADFVAAGRDLAHREAAAAGVNRRRYRLLVGLLALPVIFLLYNLALWVLAARANPLVTFPAAAQLTVGDKESRGSPRTLTTTLPTFAIDRYEVSNYQFRLCRMTLIFCRQSGDGDSSAGRGNGALPVIGVDAVRAQAFCRWLGRRLPQEIEWVRAAYGEGNRPFPWGSEAPRPDLLNIDFDELDEQTPALAPITAYPLGATPENVFNLAGNVWEWTATPYTTTYPYLPQHMQALETLSGATLVKRGGGRESTLRQLSPDDPSQQAFRERFLSRAGFSDDYTGFRCAR